MKNIFRTTTPDNQTLNEITTNKITVTEDLCLSGFGVGSLLTNDNDGDDCVNELPIGNQNNLLSVDPALLQPRWTNNITVDEVNTDSLKFISGTTVEGDLLTIDTDNETVDRIPLGATGTILTSNGTQPEWQPLVLPEPLVLNNLTVNNEFRLPNQGNGKLVVINGLVQTVNEPTYSFGTFGPFVNINILQPNVWDLSVAQYEVMLTGTLTMDSIVGADSNIFRVAVRDTSNNIIVDCIHREDQGNPEVKDFVLRFFWQNANSQFRLSIERVAGDASATCFATNILLSARITI